ncbi:MAG: glycosyltransferase family A protein [Pseudomonadota bacterium]
MPKASIIIPAYNTEEYIADALEGALAQSCPDYEVIVVNDGSTDGTMNVVDRYTSDRRLKVVEQANRGLNGARNSGIHAAESPFIGICDADDIWLPGKLALHLRHFKADSRVGLSFSPSAMIDEDGAPLGLTQSPQLRGIDAEVLMRCNPVGNGSAAVLARKALDDIAYRPEGETERDWWFDETLRQSTDIECWIRLALTTNWKIEGVDGALTLYRINSGGLSANVPRQLETWEKMVAKMAEINPEFVARNAPRARSYQLRYLARRCVTLRDGGLAWAMAWRSLTQHPAILTETPLKSFTTIGAAAALKLFGAGAYERAEDAVLGLKRRLA